MDRQADGQTKRRRGGTDNGSRTHKKKPTDGQKGGARLSCERSDILAGAACCSVSVYPSVSRVHQGGRHRLAQQLEGLLRTIQEAPVWVQLVRRTAVCAPHLPERIGRDTVGVSRHVAPARRDSQIGIGTQT
jgi:hypothetical protein